MDFIQTMTLSVSSLVADKKIGKFDVFQSLLETLDKNQEKLREGDIIVISTKYISNSQGRIVNLENVHISFEGKELSKRFRIKPEISEIILRESDKIIILNLVTKKLKQKIIKLSNKYDFNIIFLTIKGA